jgi:hypothetical protein
MKKYLFFVAFYFQYLNAYAQYFPPKRENITQNIFEEYTSLLKGVYIKQQKKTIDYNIALCFAYLGESKDSVYYHLEQGFKEYPSITCGAVSSRFLIQKISKKNLFEQVDSLKWKQFCEKCDSFTRQQKKVIDTITHPHLANLLREISNNDQLFRLELSELSDPIQKSALWIKQKKLDSVNLSKIDSLIAIYGYPGKSKVGVTLGNVAFFVIQHTPDTNTKEKYLPVLITATRQSEISSSLLRLMLDRIYLEHYDKQIFGTQQRLNPLTNKNEIPLIDSKEIIQEWLKKWNALDIYPEFLK